MPCDGLLLTFCLLCRFMPLHKARDPRGCLRQDRAWLAGQSWCFDAEMLPPAASDVTNSGICTAAQSDAAQRQPEIGMTMQRCIMPSLAFYWCFDFLTIVRSCPDPVCLLRCGYATWPPSNPKTLQQARETSYLLGGLKETAARQNCLRQLQCKKRVWMSSVLVTPTNSQIQRSTLVVNLLVSSCFQRERDLSTTHLRWMASPARQQWIQVREGLPIKQRHNRPVPCTYAGNKANEANEASVNWKESLKMNSLTNPPDLVSIDA